MSYNRDLAVEYALNWALKRNPKYYDYENLGGDCTNFVSQCLFAGINKMNFRNYGWYYFNANNKSPSWTGAKYFYEFLINNTNEGPKGKIINRNMVRVGDIIFLSFDNIEYTHCMIITKIIGNQIFICCHSIDSKNRSLNSYIYKDIKFISIS